MARWPARGAVVGEMAREVEYGAERLHDRRLAHDRHEAEPATEWTNKGHQRTAKAAEVHATLLRDSDLRL